MVNRYIFASLLPLRHKKELMVRGTILVLCCFYRERDVKDGSVAACLVCFVFLVLFLLSGWMWYIQVLQFLSHAFFVFSSAGANKGKVYCSFIVFLVFCLFIVFPVFCLFWRCKGSCLFFAYYLHPAKHEGHFASVYPYISFVFLAFLL